MAKLELQRIPCALNAGATHAWHHADDQLFEIVIHGPAVAMRDPDYLLSMPSFQATLDDTAIVSILVFIRSTWLAHLQKWQNGANEAQTGKSCWLEEEVIEEVE